MNELKMSDVMSDDWQDSPSTITIDFSKISADWNWTREDAEWLTKKICDNFKNPPIVHLDWGQEPSKTVIAEWDHGVLQRMWEVPDRISRWNQFTNWWKRVVKRGS